VRRGLVRHGCGRRGLRRAGDAGGAIAGDWLRPADARLPLAEHRADRDRGDVGQHAQHDAGGRAMTRASRRGRRVGRRRIDYGSLPARMPLEMRVGVGIRVPAQEHDLHRIDFFERRRPRELLHFVRLPLWIDRTHCFIAGTCNPA
jgi:hypothetical protein